MKTNEMVMNMMCLCRLYIASNSKLLKTEIAKDDTKERKFVNTFNSSFKGLCDEDKQYIKENFFFNYNILPKQSFLVEKKKPTSLKTFVKHVNKAYEAL